ncbi:S-layer family protein [Lysobacter pythonis]|uniref:S-layer family protein n=1 Tax=Solilutibacter pythonis TaxID=2483112 RepID=A0A3M2HXA5_9GAMM|nr:S-layer family protein [Lysobacter pythonis]
MESASAESQLKAGRNMLITVDSDPTNQASAIAAGQRLLVNGRAGDASGAANVSNIAIAGSKTTRATRHVEINANNQTGGSPYAQYRSKGGNNKRDTPNFSASTGTSTQTNPASRVLLGSSITAVKTISIDAHDITNAAVALVGGSASVGPGSGWQGSGPGGANLGARQRVGNATANEVAVKIAEVSSGPNAVALSGNTATVVATSVNVQTGGQHGDTTVTGQPATNVGAGTVNATDTPNVGANLPAVGNPATPPPQVLGSVANPLPALTPPTGRLFTQHPGSGRYLVTTDPRFANYRQWLGSDYMMRKLGLAPDNVLRRLGDDYYEQWLVTEQITGLTGRKYLAASNSLDQYRELMDAGVRSASRFSLGFGIALSAEQIAALNEDIV